MHDARRGEVEGVLDGRPHVLCLTLGALAELETAYGAADLPALAERLGSGRLTARDLVLILTAGLRGGGAEIDEAAVARMRCEDGAAGMARLAARLLTATFGGGEGEETKHPLDAGR